MYTDCCLGLLRGARVEERQEMTRAGFGSWLGITQPDVRCPNNETFQALHFSPWEKEKEAFVDVVARFRDEKATPL